LENAGPPMHPIRERNLGRCLESLESVKVTPNDRRKQHTTDCILPMHFAEEELNV
jgi:hypothetical protein